MRAYAVAEATIGALRAARAAGDRASTRRSTAGSGTPSAIATPCCRCCGSWLRRGCCSFPRRSMGATLPLLARYFVTRPSSCGGVGAAHRDALRREPVRRGGRFVLRRLRVLARCSALRCDQRRRRQLQPQPRRRPILLARRLTRRPAPAARHARRAARRGRSAGARGPAALPPTPVITPARRRAVLVAFAVSGAHRHDPAGAVDPRAGRGHRLVGVLVHPHPAGLPDRPRGAGSALFGRLAPANRPPGALARPPCTWASPPPSGLSYLFTDELPYVFTWLLALDQLRGGRHPGLPVRAGLRWRCCPRPS